MELTLTFSWHQRLYYVKEFLVQQPFKDQASVKFIPILCFDVVVSIVGLFDCYWWKFLWAADLIVDHLIYDQEVR